MRHEHIVVTLDAETKRRVLDSLGDGESVEAWVADAIESKLREADNRPQEDAGYEFADDCGI
ncbi:hypothetical protein [Halorussus halophilus]|uniref:hypothetical protein n=1 Tax=Halorussus halophilus TaxID=2650975 RepID=UPI001301272C|nr:hypothetical protein [Halorussus halophilus]